MELDYLLRWLVGVSCLLRAWPLIQQQPARWRRSVLPFALVLAVLAGGHLLLPGWGGWLATAAYLLLVSLPARLERWLHDALVRRQGDRALRLATALSVLAPGGPWTGMRRVLALTNEARREPLERSLPALRAAAGPDTPEAQAAAVLAFRIQGDWEGCLAWIEAHFDVANLSDPGLVSTWLRALGETGAVDGMLLGAARLGHSRSAAAATIQSPTMVVVLLAFAGRERGVELLLEDSLSSMPDAGKDYWRGVAACAAGREEAGRALLERSASLALSGPRLDRIQAAEARARLARPPLPPSLSPVAAEIADRSTRVLEAAAQQQPGTRPIVTWTLVAACVAVFVAGALLSGPDGDPLIGLGALAPSLVLAGEWWRLVTAMFLHAGVLHLAVNSYGLWILGPPTERAMGRLRFIVTYFAAGLGSMLTVVIVTLVGRMSDGWTVGASGAILGLVGMLAAVIVRRRWPDWKRRLVPIAVVVGIQTLFDAMTPQVSMAAHLGGLVTGFVVGYLLVPRSGRFG